MAISSWTCHFPTPPRSSGRTRRAGRIEEILKKTPGVEHFQGISGFSLLSVAQNTYSGFFFVTLKEWNERTKAGGASYEAIMDHVNRELAKLPEAIAFAFPPPAIRARVGRRRHVHPRGPGGQGHRFSR